MLTPCLRWTLALIAAAAAVLPAHAAPPVLTPGGCVYLVGAPPGGTSAPDVSTVSGTKTWDDCLAVSHVGTGETGPNSVQAAIEGPTAAYGSFTECRMAAWTAHEFAVGPGAAAVEARITMAGHVTGTMGSPPTTARGEYDRVRLLAELVEVPSAGSEPVTLDQAVILDETQLSVWFVLDDPFARGFNALLLPGRTYRVQLLLLVDGDAGASSIDDFGSPGSGNGAHYDSIEVCLEAPQDDAAVRAQAALEDDHIEQELFARQCVPSLWLPAAQGGKLDRARALVADLVSRAVASGDVSLNAQVAQSRLTQADSYFADQAYQRTCRSLIEAIHAITTP